MNIRQILLCELSAVLVCGLAFALFYAKRDGDLRSADRLPYLFNSADHALISEAKARSVRIRNGSARLVLHDSSGIPLTTGTRVHYRLVLHAFGFGASDKLFPQLEAARAPLGTNTHTILGFWNGVVADSNPTKHDFSASERFNARPYRTALGDTLVYHNVLWTIYGKKDGDKIEGWIPTPYAQLKGFDRQRDAILDHVASVAEFTRGKYHVVNLYNEPFNKWSNWFKWTVPQSLEIIDSSARRFRSVNPDSQLMLNLGSGIWTFLQRLQVPDLLETLKARGTPIDRIGLQLWSNAIFEWNAPSRERMTVSFLSRRLKEFAAYGFPLDITEFAVPAAGKVGDGEWTEQRQADFADAVFWIAYGTPGVESFTYFCTADRFILHSGLLDPNGNRRPVWHRLKQTIDSLTTAGTADLDSQSALTISGTAGEYLVTAALPGNRTLQYRAHVAPRESLDATLAPVTLPPPAPEPYRSLSPRITANMILTGSIAPLSNEAPPLPRASLPQPTASWFEVYTGKPRRAAIEPDGSWSVEFDSGVSLSQIPPGASVSFDVNIDSAGPLGYLQIVAGTRRMYFENVPPGRHRVTFDPAGASDATLIFSQKLGAPKGHARLLGWTLRR